jgi:hypothetical protein
MAKSLDPQHVSATNWYYEEGAGMLVVHEVRDAAGLYLQTDQFKIPWRKIEASLKRIKARKRRAARTSQ